MVDVEKIIEKLIENKDKAYAPYSNFKVSSACVCQDEVYYGVNVENASYPAGICAERSAIAKAVSDGKRYIDMIIITGDKDFTYPCGICRQTIREFSDENTKIVIAHTKDDYKVLTLADLLPYSFSKEDLQ